MSSVQNQHLMLIKSCKTSTFSTKHNLRNRILSSNVYPYTMVKCHSKRKQRLITSEFNFYFTLLIFQNLTTIFNCFSMYFYKEVKFQETVKKTLIFVAALKSFTDFEVINSYQKKTLNCCMHKLFTDHCVKSSKVLPQIIFMIQNCCLVASPLFFKQMEESLWFCYCSFGLLWHDLS